MYHHPNLVDLPDPGPSVERRFETNAGAACVWLVAGLLLLACGVVAFSYWARGEMPGKKGALPFLLTGAGAGLTLGGLKNLLLPRRVVVTAEGLAVGREVCPWTEVAAVGEQFVPAENLNPLRIWVYRKDGWNVRLSMWQLSGLPQLLAIIHHNTHSRLLSEARAALDRGESVPFGRVDMSATGLRARGRELSWEQVSHVVPDEAGDLGVWEIGGKKPWLDVATGTVDNVRVLLELVEQYAPASAYCTE